MYKIEISEDAEQDILKSTEYYEIKQKGLGKRFFGFVLKAFDVILKQPFSFQKTDNNIRKHVLQKFPFVILYIVGKTVIRIIAVFHTSRNPEIVKNRLEKEDL